MNASELPRRWAITRLGDLCAGAQGSLVGGPFGSDLTSSDYQVEPGVPVIRGSNLGGDTGEFVDDGFVFVSEEKAQLLRRNSAGPGDIIFTQRGTLGQVAIIPIGSRFPRYVISQSQMRMTADTNRIAPRFLFHFFRSPKSLSRISARALTTGVPHINLGILREFPVEFPALAEQRRIAEVLDRAETLRAKRRAALAQLDTLAQAIFLDMFGDPATNPKGWATKPFGEVCSSRLGKMLDQKQQTGQHRRPYLRNANVQWFHFDLRNMLEMDFDADDREVFRLRHGDLLICEGGEPGRAAVWRGEIGECYYQKALHRARPSRRLAIAEYLAWLLWFLVHRGRLRGVTSATIAHLTGEKLTVLPIMLPTLEAQRDFAHRVAAVEKLKATHRASLAELDALFASLQHRAFRGEL